VLTARGQTLRKSYPKTLSVIRKLR